MGGIIRIGAALALVLLFAAFLVPAPGSDLKNHVLDVNSEAGMLLDKVAKTFWDDRNIRAVLYQAQNLMNADSIEGMSQNSKSSLTYIERESNAVPDKARTVFYQAQNTINADSIEGLNQNFKSSLAYINRESNLVPDKARAVLPGVLIPYIDLARIHWQIVIGILFIISILSLLEVKSVFIAGEDWSRCSSEYDVKVKYIEPLLKGRKFDYISERPCKFRQGHETLEGKIDFYLYDGYRPVTIFEVKNTIKSDEDLKNARAQARSYCIGLYIYENIAVNSFVIASKEGLWIYQIKNNEDHLIERVSPEKLNRSKKRWIKDKLLEIR